MGGVCMCLKTVPSTELFLVLFSKISLLIIQKFHCFDKKNFDNLISKISCYTNGFSPVQNWEPMSIHSCFIHRIITKNKSC